MTNQLKALEILKILNKYYTGKFAIKINEAIEELEKINSCNDCKYDNDSLVDTLNKCESCKRYYQDKFEAKE